jgi:hypothetical protein
MNTPKDPFIHRLPVKAKSRGKPFAKGNPGGPGRPRGSQDKMTRELKQALLAAVENVGEQKAAERASKRKADGLAPEKQPLRGISAYLEWIAVEHPKTMSALLSRILPTRVESEHSVSHINYQYQTFDEIAARLRELGLEPKRIYPMFPMLEAKSDKPNGDGH